MLKLSCLNRLEPNLFLACGKTTFVFRLIRQRALMIDDPPVQIIYALPANQEIHVPDDIKNDKDVVFFKGIPNFEDFNDKKPRLVVIDDQIQDCGDQVVTLFTRGSHHFNVSVILLTQNIFFSSPGFRTMSINSHYLVLFKSPRTQDQVACLGRQICPDNIKFFQESYVDSCREPHSYMLLDMTQSTDEDLRFRSKIFADDKDGPVVYVKINKNK
jgi:hypothetical protein